MSKAKLLVQFTIAGNKLCSLLSDIRGESIHPACYSVPQIFGLLQPKQGNAIQLDWNRRESEALVTEDDSLSFALGRYDICTEGDSMVSGISVGDVQHLLQTRSGGTEEQEVICISMDSSVVLAYPATASRALESGEEVVHIETK